MTVKNIYDFLDSIAPYSDMCGWDNSGFNLGDMNGEVCGIAVALDCTNDVLDEAERNGCNLIVCHHPLIFNPLKKLEFGTPVCNAAAKGVNVISCHTNFDMADGGVNDVLADILKLKNVEKLYAEGKPLMRVGETDSQSGKVFAEFCSENLNNAVKFFDSGKKVQKIAVCSGAGGEYVFEAAEAGCDTLVTGEAKHHEFLDAENLKINLVVAGHYSTENPAMKVLQNKLKTAFPDEKVVFIIGKRPYETVI